VCVLEGGDRLHLFHQKPNMSKVFGGGGKSDPRKIGDVIFNKIDKVVRLNVFAKFYFFQIFG
jgi:hypothetical protein